MAVLPDGFYAVPDPDGPDEPGGDAMTFWRVLYGGIEAYPRRAKYGPIPPPRKDLPSDREERDLWMRSWDVLRHEWATRIRAAIEADPMAARRRFAEGSARCCECGRPLASGRSRLLGLGDRCREQMPHDLLSAYLAEVKRAREVR